MSARSLPLSQSENTQKITSGTARPITLNETEVSRFRSLISAPLKGLLKELPTLSKLINPWEYFLPKNTFEKFYEENVEKYLPTRPEALEKGLERFGRGAPYYALGGVAGLVRGALGSAAAQGVEELGGGPLAQGIADIAAQAAPGFARKIIPSNAEQKVILDFGRSKGLTEEQLALLMPESLKRKTFGTLASKGEAAQGSVAQMQQGGKTVYQAVKSSPQAQQFLSPQGVTDFVRETNKIAMDLPYAIRSQLKNDALDLVKSAQKKGGITGEELINFYKDVSSRYNIGRTQLELFKGPIKNAISSIDPQLAKEFDIANKIWSRQAKMAQTLSPGKYDGLINLGETVATASAIATGDMDLLSKILGVTGMKFISRKILTSPRMQNLVEQSQKAIAENNVAALRQIGEIAKSEIEKSEKQ